MSANNKQHGGNHYKKYGDLQPWDVVIAWNLGYLEGTALKYIARWKDKNGVEDILKAIHFLEKLVEVEKQKQQAVDLPQVIDCWAKNPFPKEQGVWVGMAADWETDVMDNRNEGR